MTLARAAAILGLVTASLGVLGAAWAGLDYLDVRPVISRELKAVEAQVASNSMTLALQRWQYLNTKRQTQGLSASEAVEYCKLARVLGLQGAGCA